MPKVTQFKYKTPLFLLLTLLSCFLVFKIGSWWVNEVNEYPYPYNINPGSIHLTPDYCKTLGAFIYVDDAAEGYTLTFTQKSITEDSSQVVQEWYQGQGWAIYSGKYGDGLAKSEGQFNLLGRRIRVWSDVNVYPSSVFPQKTHNLASLTYNTPIFEDKASLLGWIATRPKRWCINGITGR